MQEQGLLNQYSDLWIKDLKSPMFLNLQKKLNNLLESLKLTNKHIILAVSWWADSMLVACEILHFYHINKLDFNNIHIAHCNHKIRKVSENEARFMKQFFDWLDLCINNI